MVHITDSKYGRRNRNKVAMDGHKQHTCYSKCGICPVSRFT